MSTYDVDTRVRMSRIFFTWALGLVAFAAANEPLYDDSSPLTLLDDSKCARTASVFFAQTTHTSVASAKSFIRMHTRFALSHTSLRTLSPHSFESLVLRDEKNLWVVEFYADWCGHCKQFKRAYEKAAANLDGLVKFGALNGDTYKKTGGSQGVQGFPSVKLYVPGTGGRNPYTGKFFKPPLDYSGPRNAKAVVDFVTEKLPSSVVPVTDASLSKFKSNNATLPKALLFTKKTETTPLLKALSTRLFGRMVIGEARDTAVKSFVEYGISEYPTLIVLPADGSEAITYTGELKPAALSEFLEGHAAPEPEKTEASEGGGGKPAAEEDSLVVDIDGSNVKSLVEGERDAWLLVFPGASKPDVETEGGINALAESLYGQVKVGKVTSSDLADKFGVKTGGEPVIAMWPFRKAGSKRKAESFAGTSDGVASAKKAALETLPDDGVTKVSLQTVDQFMSEAMMTSETRAFVMLFSDKPTVPPLLRALALEFDGKLGFGMADARDKQLAQRFNVQKAPFLLMMWPDEKQKDPNGNAQLAGMPFNPQQHGKFNFGNLASFIAQLVDMRMREVGKEGGAGAGGGEGQQQQPPQRELRKDLGPIPELTADSFDTECVAKGGLCGIALLDGASENSGKEPALEMLTKLRQRKSGGPISFSWLDATCHTNFLSAFELGDTDLPTMIFVSPQKLKWARSVGAFDQETLSAFGNRVVAGRQSTNSLSELPQLDPEVDCATVKRGAEAYVEEEDGADDIMAEILEEERRKREALEAELAAEKGSQPEESKPSSGKKKSEMSKLELLESEIEECEAMDLLCSARKEKQTKAYEKERELQEKLRKIAKKKKKAKAKAKKAGA